MGRLSYVMVDCRDPERLAAFWGALLGVGVASRVEPYVDLEPATPGAPALGFQRVPEAKAGKNRVHADLSVADLETATARVEELGGRRVGDREQGGVCWRVMADPEGNEFCLIPEGV